MKVNIRYTVDLEEVLDEMSNLYFKSNDALDRKLEIYDHFLRNGFNEADVEHVITALEHNLDCYVDHQTKVAEVLNILRGYKSIKDGDTQQPVLEQEPQTPNE
tara:strand:+ start:284 stop:592 length:309 start_codon:yes stop_codon:yes gene_type:complete